MVALVLVSGRLVVDECPLRGLGVDCRQMRERGGRAMNEYSVDEKRKELGLAECQKTGQSHVCVTHVWSTLSKC